MQALTRNTLDFKHFEGFKMITRLLAVVGFAVMVKAAYEHYQEYSDLKSYKKHHQDGKDHQTKEA